VSGLVESFLFFKLRVGSGIDRASLSDVSAWRSPVTYAASPSLACCCCFHCWVSGRHLTVRRESTSRQSTVIRRIRIVTTSSICCFHCWVSGRHLTQCVANVRSISVHPAARSASVCASSPYSTHRLVSSNRPTRYASAASCSAIRAELWNRIDWPLGKPAGHLPGRLTVISLIRR
jgi:hypothetical protein